MIQKTIQVRYVCGKCDLPERKVAVIGRGATEDIVVFMERLTAKLMQDHWSMSPGCNPGEFECVKIPLGPEGTVTEKTRIGEAF